MPKRKTARARKKRSLPGLTDHPVSADEFKRLVDNSQPGFIGCPTADLTRPVSFTITANAWQCYVGASREPGQAYVRFTQFIVGGEYTWTDGGVTKTGDAVAYITASDTMAGSPTLMALACAF